MTEARTRHAHDVMAILSGRTLTHDAVTQTIKQTCMPDQEVHSMVIDVLSRAKKGYAKCCEELQQKWGWKNA